MTTKHIDEWLRTVRAFEGDLTERGYKHLGWQLSFQNEHFKRCREAKHSIGNKSFSQRGSHETYWCDECRHWWNIDMSD